jgi:L-ascorbate metabolism protein UlaG (beta-lactamase superfamily)
LTIYKNLDGTTPDKRFGALFKWQVTDRLAGRRTKADDSSFVTPRRDNDGAALAARTPHLTWIGHATFAMRLAQKLVITDPIFAARVGPSKRLTDPGVKLEQLPPIDVVTISHSHFDHLDMPTLKRIGNAPLYVVPKDVGAILKHGGLDRVIELDWWETHREDDLAITLVPSQHWSMRMPWDRNKRLWGGFVYESSEGTSYHAGDTAFNAEVFTKIAERFPKIDWAMLPIGAYDPPWFMQPQHMGPEEAGRAWKLLGAKVLCAMHWGTFKLTDEPLAEPPARLRAWWKEQGHDPERCWIFDIGETRALR